MKKSICPVPFGTGQMGFRYIPGVDLLLISIFYLCFTCIKLYYHVAVFSLQSQLDRQDPQVFFHGDGRIV